MNGCINSQTILRKMLVKISPKKPPRWLTARMVWRFYGFLDWLSWRMQDLALVLEDMEREHEHSSNSLYPGLPPRATGADRGHGNALL